MSQLYNLKTHKLHPSVSLALKHAAQFGFLNKDQFLNYLAPKTKTQKYEVWKNLIQENWLKFYSTPIKSHQFCYLSGKAIKFLNQKGVVSVKRTHPLFFEHDLAVSLFTLANQTKNLIKPDWLTEAELKLKSNAEILNIFGSTHFKIPDLIFHLNLSKESIKGALEIERSRKSNQRYDNLILNYKRMGQINFVLVIYTDHSIKEGIQRSAKNLNFPENLRPLIFAKMSDFLIQPANFEIEIGFERILLSEYVKGLEVAFKIKLNFAKNSSSGVSSGFMNEKNNGSY